MLLGARAPLTAPSASLQWPLKSRLTGPVRMINHGASCSVRNELPFRGAPVDVEKGYYPVSESTESDPPPIPSRKSSRVIAMMEALKASTSRAAQKNLAEIVLMVQRGVDPKAAIEAVAGKPLDRHRESDVKVMLDQVRSLKRHVNAQRQRQAMVRTSRRPVRTVRPYARARSRRRRAVARAGPPSDGPSSPPQPPDVVRLARAVSARPVSS